MAKEIAQEGGRERTRRTGRFSRAEEDADAQPTARRGRPTAPDAESLDVDRLKDGLASQRSPRTIIRALKEIGFTDSDLAEATKSSHSTVAKWRSTTLPTSAARTKLDQLRAVVLFLIVHGVAPLGAYSWVTGVDSELAWRRPLDCIADGDFDQVTRRAEEVAPAGPIGNRARDGSPDGSRVRGRDTAQA